MDQTLIESAAPPAWSRERSGAEEAAARLRVLVSEAVTEHDRVDAAYELAKLLPEDPDVGREAIDAIATLYEPARRTCTSAATTGS